MAVNVLYANDHYYWVKTVAGGSLPANTDFYLIFWMAYCPSGAQSAYYGYSPGRASEEFKVTTDITNRQIKFELYQQGGNVTSYANAGGGQITVSALAHGLSNGDTAYIRGTTNYDGIYTISNVTTNTFNITATWVSDDGASKWFATPGQQAPITNFNGDLGLYFKWDYYSMKRADGSYFDWGNANDPAVTDEYYSTRVDVRNYGHYRWGGTYYNNGIRGNKYTTESDGSKTWLLSSVVITSGGGYFEDHILYERANNTTTLSGNFAHPQIALRSKYSSNGITYVDYYGLPNWMDKESPAVLLYVDNNNDNNAWQYVISAIKASPLLRKSIDLTSDSVSTSYDNASNITLRGSVISNSYSKTTPIVWANKNIIMIQGMAMSEASINNPQDKILFDSCQLYSSRIQTNLWVQPSATFKNSTYYVFGNAFCLNDIATPINFTPKSDAISSYGNIENYNIIGNPLLGSNTLNIVRYFSTGSYIKNCIFSRNALYPTYTFAGDIVSPGITWLMENIEFNQITSDLANSPNVATGHNFDIMYEDSYTAGKTLKVLLNCYNVTSKERANGLVRMMFVSQNRTTPNFNLDSDIKTLFHQKIKIKVKSGDTPLEGASVTISNSKSTPDVYSAITDSDGLIELSPEIYSVNFDPDNYDGYSYNGTTRKFFSKTTIYNNISIEIKKDGYETYNGSISNCLEAQELNITVKPNPAPLTFSITRLLSRIFKSGKSIHSNEILTEGAIEHEAALDEEVIISNLARATYRPESEDILIEQEIDGIWEEAEIIAEGSEVVRGSTSVIDDPAPIFIDQQINVNIEAENEISAVMNKIVELTAKIS